MTQPTQILIIEDDPVLNGQLAHLLTEANYGVDQSYCGDEGLQIASRQQHQLIVLDVMLPGLDGYSLLGELRKTSQVPVIMLTAKGAEEERIQGLSQGADDYVAKPFNTTELMLRIEALLRRSQVNAVTESAQSISLQGLLVDRGKQRALAYEQPLPLTPIQFNLLWQLMQHQGEVLTKAYLHQTVLKRPLGAHDRSLDMHLSRVRRKLNDANWPGERLQTVHGKGYCLT